MKTYMTDHSKTHNGRRYSAYQLDLADQARRRAEEPWIVTKILGALLVVGFVAAAFASAGPFMGVPMVIILLISAFRS